ncbi:MAG: precorrin-6y C5,15-methyltransferase (decarboxylating) subunit CbiE [bacterium]
MKLNKIYITGISRCHGAHINLEQSILKISHIDSVFARKEDEPVLKEIKNKNNINITRSSQIFYGSKIKFILDYINENIAKKNILILADGDPNFFGIAGTIFNNTEEKLKKYIEVIPTVSYMQKGFASLKISMADSEIISLHGRNTSNLFKALYTFKNIGLYTDEINNPYSIYKILVDKGFGSYYKFYVLSNLCLKNEKILSLNIKLDKNFENLNIEKILEEFNHTNNIVILERIANSNNNNDDNNGGGNSISDNSSVSNSNNADSNSDNGSIINSGNSIIKNNNNRIIRYNYNNYDNNIEYDNVLGINDDDFIHGKGEPTKKEIRAVALSMLELKRNSIMIDAGCGCGSVSIEAAAIAECGMIYSIDKNKIKINNLLKNIKKFKRPNIEPILGEMPLIFNVLKDKMAYYGFTAPDSIFIGGGGISIGNVIDNSFNMLKNNGVIVVNCLMLDTLNKVMSFIENNKNKIKYEIISLNISRLESISYSSYFKALNQVYLIKIIKNN